MRVRNVNKMLMEMKDLISTAVLVPGKLLIVVIPCRQEGF